MNYEDFITQFKPQINHIMRNKTSPDIADGDVAPFNGSMYETYGDEYEHVKTIPNNRTWTVVDGPGEDLVIISGRNYINRIGYIITEEPWTEFTEVN